MSCTATMRAARLNTLAELHHLMLAALSHTWLPLTLPCDADSAAHGVTTRICNTKAIGTGKCGVTLYARRRAARHFVLRHYSGAIGLHARQPDITSREHTQAHWDHVLLCNVYMCCGATCTCALANARLPAAKDQLCTSQFD